MKNRVARQTGWAGKQLFYVDFNPGKSEAFEASDTIFHHHSTDCSIKRGREKSSNRTSIIYPIISLDEIFLAGGKLTLKKNFP